MAATAGTSGDGTAGVGKHAAPNASATELKADSRADETAFGAVRSAIAGLTASGIDPMANGPA